MSSATCFNLDHRKILSSGNGLMYLNILFTDINDNATESAEQDQSAHKCMLLPSYTLKLNLCPQTAG